jgi:hypothetical protein
VLTGGEGLLVERITLYVVRNRLNGRRVPAGLVDCPAGKC